MSLNTLSLIPLLALISFFSGQANSAILLVPSEHATIQLAVDAATNGDVVLVSPGTYAGTTNVFGKIITLRSTDGPDLTILDGNSAGTVIRFSTASAPGETTLEGFTVRNGSSTFGAGISLGGGSQTVIRGNVFSNNNQGSGGAGAAIDCNGCTSLVTQNVFSGNSCDSQFSSGVVSVVNAATIEIRSNLFVDNPCRAVNITAPSSARPSVLGNTMIGNATGIYIDARTNDNSAQILRHNLIAFNEIGLDVVFAFAPLNAQFADNVLFGNTMQVAGGAGNPIGNLGNRNVDPLMIDPANGDYRLRADSSLIDAPIGAAGTPRIGANAI
ncbi:MAG: right-handed parallel beta-helix repeat-containing protein [Ahniella sp.]|nr:right-handed parallel beta-helix repeat-containing protein [Ahniella sp.]